MTQGYNELTLDIIKSSSEAGQLLVKLYDKHQLYSLAKEAPPESRGELATIMAELLAIDLTLAENELITDVLMSLIRQAETDLKRAIAERMSVFDDAPLRLVLHLANDEINVSDAILRRSRVLNDSDLTYIVKSQKAPHWRAIATRPFMSEKLIDMLADTQDLETAIQLAENNNIHLSDYSMEVFSEMSRNSDLLAKPLLLRRELPKKLAMKLYHFVGRELKEFIRDNYKNISALKTDETIDDVIAELTSSSKGDFVPTVKMHLAAETLQERGQLNSELMVANLRRGQIANFVAMLSIYGGLSMETTTEILKQTTGQGLAIVCKATGIPKSDFVNMFLLTSRIRGGRIIDQHQLGRALAYYDRIKESMAKKIINKSRH